MNGKHEKMISGREMGTEATVDSNQMKQTDGSASSSEKTGSGNNGTVAKSCKGCLYYSSHLKADSRNPLCVGLPRSLQRVPQSGVSQSNVEAKKKDKSPTDFRYVCVGYSLYLEHKEPASNGQEAKTVLPACMGVEVLMQRDFKSADSASAPTTPHREENGGLKRQRGSSKTTHTAGEEFLSRFNRNAILVANKVAKDIGKAGNQIKQSLEDILHPFGRRPK